MAHVITRYGQAHCNLRTQFTRYIRQAGLSERVARKPYLQTTDEHFGKANGTAGAAAEAGPKSDAKSDTAPGGTGPRGVAPIDLLMEKTREILRVEKRCDLLQLKEWAVQGSNL